MRRFYRLDIQPDLFGRWLLVREWGRVGCGGQRRVASFATAAEARDALDRQRRRKGRRGYVAKQAV